MYVYKWLATVILPALVWLPAVSQASMKDDFAAGVAAAQRQEYAKALKYFEAAERAGMSKPLLYYNLGVSYYRERRLYEAETSFRRAAQSPQLAALSYYNLGLIARDQGKREHAINRFKHARAMAKTEKMRRLSELALQRMITPDTAEPEPAAPWFIWVEGGIGYDSNAALAADFATKTGGRDETFGFSAYGHYDFTRLRLHGLVNLEHYSELHDFNFDLLETGASLPLENGAWRFRPGLSLRRMRVGDESLQDSAALLFQSTLRMGGDFDLKFYLEHEAIDAGGGYQHLEGTRNYFQASVSTPADRWRLVWDVELNDREDLAGEASSEFFSFSPRRIQWQLEYRNPLTERINLKLAAGLQDSKYRGTDIRIDDEATVVTEMRRSDDRNRLILELEYRHRNDWQSRMELIYLERNSNFAEYDYDRTTLMLSVGRTFGQ